MNKSSKKEFDAVQMMRKIRDELAKKYNSDPEAETRELEKIRRKYQIKISESNIIDTPPKL